MATKANHHFIPKFYLRGFADSAGRQAKVFTFDKETKKTFPTLIRNIGSRRHFFRVEADGVDPNAVEDAMGEIESEFSNHLSDVISTNDFPTDEHFNSVMNIIANISVRNPRFRKVEERAYSDIFEKILDISLSTKERWESQIRAMQNAGYSVNAGLTYEEMKRFNDSRQYDIAVNQTHLVSQEIKLVTPVLRCLAGRNWCFAVADGDSQFICSDDPVVLSWINESKKGPFSPGHGLEGTIVIFPLCSRLLLLGTFEEIPKRLSYNLAQVTVANTTIAMYSTKQIYARDGSFLINLKSKEYVKGADLPEHFDK